MTGRFEWEEEDRLEREHRDRLRAQVAQEIDEEAAKRRRAKRAREEREDEWSSEEEIYQCEQAYEFEDEMRLSRLFREIERELAVDADSE